MHYAVYCRYYCLTKVEDTDTEYLKVPLRSKITLEKEGYLHRILDEEKPSLVADAKQAMRFGKRNEAEIAAYRVALDNFDEQEQLDRTGLPRHLSRISILKIENNDVKVVRYYSGRKPWLSSEELRIVEAQRQKEQTQHRRRA
jgi:hypothetical protein